MRVTHLLKTYILFTKNSIFLKWSVKLVRSTLPATYSQYSTHQNSLNPFTYIRISASVSSFPFCCSPVYITYIQVPTAQQQFTRKFPRILVLYILFFCNSFFPDWWNVYARGAQVRVKPLSIISYTHVISYLFLLFLHSNTYIYIGQLIRM